MAMRSSTNTLKARVFRFERAKGRGFSRGRSRRFSAPPEGETDTFGSFKPEHAQPEACLEGTIPRMEQKLIIKIQFHINTFSIDIRNITTSLFRSFYCWIFGNKISTAASRQTSRYKTPQQNTNYNNRVAAQAGARWTELSRYFLIVLFTYGTSFRMLIRILWIQHCNARLPRIQGSFQRHRHDDAKPYFRPDSFRPPTSAQRILLQ